MSSNLSNLTNAPKSRDGKLLLGSYSLYIGQLIFTLKQNANWKVILSQVIVFICIILSRVYKKKSDKIQDASSQCDSEAPRAITDNDEYHTPREHEPSYNH